MDFFDKVSETLSAKGKEVSEKAKVMAEIARLKSQISSCEEIIKNNYSEIGQLYYEEYSDMPEAPFEKQCTAIRNAKRGIEEIKARIDELKGVQ